MAKARYIPKSTVFEELAAPKAKGKPNPRNTGGAERKESREVKWALIKAFYDLGGIPGLVAWGQDNPTDFYKLWARILPHEVRTNLQAVAKAQEQSVQIEFVNDAGAARQGTRVTIGKATAKSAQESTGETGSEAESEEIEFASLPPPAEAPIGALTELAHEVEAEVAVGGN